MLNVQKEDEQHHVDVFLIILGILMLSVNLSAQLTLSVQMTKRVSTISVRTHVQECVESMPHVMSQIIFLNVHVILVILGMPLLHVLESQHVSQKGFYRNYFSS